jgi:predicted secreted protein
MIMRWLARGAVAMAGLLWLSRFFIRDGGIGIVNGVVVFLLIWWVLLFTMLPIGITSQEEAGDVVAGSEPGAPMRPNLAKKLWWTTAITSAIWIAYFFLMHSGVLEQFTPHGGRWG